MSKIILIGDVHGEEEIFHKLRTKALKKYCLTTNDFIIILGDFGCIWNGFRDKREDQLLRWLDAKIFTTLFLDGNHENHIRLKQLEERFFLDGKVGIVSDKIFHLKRGEVYTIFNKKFFVFGGAESYDKIYRIENVSWWKDEIPSFSEVENGLANLEKHQFSVDYILAHTLPTSIVDIILSGKGQRPGTGRDIRDPTSKMLEHFVQITQFNKFFCGHWHEDRTFLNGKYNVLYNNNMELI